MRPLGRQALGGNLIGMKFDMPCDGRGDVRNGVVSGDAQKKKRIAN
jgi:hypothetical protein